MVGSLIIVFFGGAPEFAHNQHQLLFHPLTAMFFHTSSEVAAVIAQLFSHLSASRAFIDVMSPAAVIERCHFHPAFGLDQLGNVPHLPSKTRLGKFHSTGTRLIKYVVQLIKLLDRA